MRILLLPNSYNSPSARFRIWQFVEPLRAAGHDVEVRVTTPTREWTSAVSSRLLKRVHSQWGSISRVTSAYLMLQDAAKFDVIMMNRDIVPELGIRFLESMLAKRNPHLIFDFDDAIHIGSRENKLLEILPNFAWFTPGNPYLAEFVSQFNKPVTIIPTVVDTDHYYVSPQRKPGPIRIGWSGSASTVKYSLPLLKDSISALAKEIDFEFIVIANVNPNISWTGVNSRFILWTPETEVQGLQEIDIGLMPLNDSPFERGKCGLKAIQYMAVGTPALVSPVGVNTQVVVHGETGLHCEQQSDWIDGLRMLTTDEPLRLRMGRAARTHAEQNYSIKAVLPKLLHIFEELTSQ